MKKNFLLFLVAILSYLGLSAQSSETTFKAELDTLRAKMQRGMPPATWEQGERIGNNMTDSVVARGGMDKVLKTGAKIPAVKLNDAFGNPVDLNDMVKTGPIVLVFYRGAWCPFCNLYLRAIQKELPKIKAMGANLVAITSAKPDLEFEKTELNYTVLSDLQNKVSKEFGMVYEVTQEMDTYYKNFGKNLSKDYSTEKSELLMSGVYIIDKEGIVKYMKAEAAYKNWAEPKEILSVLATLMN